MKKTYLLALAALLTTTLVSAQTGSRSAPEFIAGGKWFNSKPLSIQDLRGKVTIVNIFVHSCFNCHNSLPTLSKWYKQYHDAGLEIVGVHTPEFESDKDPVAAAAAFKRTGVIWPVVQDNQNATCLRKPLLARVLPRGQNRQNPRNPRGRNLEPIPRRDPRPRENHSGIAGGETQRELTNLNQTRTLEVLGEISCLPFCLAERRAVFTLIPRVVSLLAFSRNA
jgi:thiol-disulfide isomerase/thioredoxin